MRIVAAVQARMGSTRLPGKVLRLIHGKPMIGWIFDRLWSCRLVDQVVVATSGHPSDNPIADAYAFRGFVVRGSLDRIDGRLREVAEIMKADAIIRITGDCPLVDPYLVDALAGAWRKWQGPRLDYASNVFPDRTYPDGLDVEIISRAFLERSVQEDWDHEAFTSNIWKAPQVCQWLTDFSTPNLGALRWTVDREDDLYFIRWVYGQLPMGFTWPDVLALRNQWAHHVRDQYRDFVMLLPPGHLKGSPAEHVKQLVEERFGT